MFHGQVVHFNHKKNIRTVNFWGYSFDYVLIMTWIIFTIGLSFDKQLITNFAFKKFRFISNFYKYFRSIN